MKKQYLMLVAIIATIGLSQTVNAQSNMPPIRYMPELNEDQFIICTKDVSNEHFKNQNSCIIVNSDDVFNQKLADKLYKMTQSLDNTFEVGLVD